MDNKRDLCVKKDFITSRNPERIPVICDLIEELWERYRLNNLSINFFQLLDLIDLSSRGKENIDTFYWEDDKWYDFLQGLIESSKKLEQNNLLENVLDMQEITNCFKEYWLMYPDYRFKQILDVFNMTVNKDNSKLNSLDGRYWRKYFLSIMINKLEKSIEVGKNRLDELNLDSPFASQIHYNLEMAIKIKQEELNRLKEEYKNDFKL